MIKPFVKYCLVILVLFLSAKSQLFANTTLHHDVKSAGNLPENFVADQNSALHLFTSSKTTSHENLKFNLVENEDNYEDDTNNSFKNVKKHGKKFSFSIFNEEINKINLDSCKLICHEFEFKYTLKNRNLLFQVFRI